VQPLVEAVFNEPEPWHASLCTLEFAAGPPVPSSSQAPPRKSRLLPRIHVSLASSLQLLWAPSVSVSAQRRLWLRRTPGGHSALEATSALSAAVRGRRTAWLGKHSPRKHPPRKRSASGLSAYAAKQVNRQPHDAAAFCQLAYPATQLMRRGPRLLACLFEKLQLHD
ncbi:MAG: hypothetical protein SGPRY_011701, partial [Prymnesium sp.]